jgi:hypothetical protein
MTKKTIIGLLVVTGIVVVYYYYNKKASSLNKNYNDKNMTTEQDGIEFYNKLSSQEGWLYSQEGIKKFIKSYSENVTKGKHNQMMDILNRSQEKRGADQSEIVQDTFDNVVEKINK